MNSPLTVLPFDAVAEQVTIVSASGNVPPEFILQITGMLAPPGSVAVATNVAVAPAGLVASRRIVAGSKIVGMSPLVTVT
ncbi:MAG: hypothetical protein AAB131_05930, partial [Actinomycetota bacterium]